MANLLPSTNNPLVSMGSAPSGPGVVLFEVVDFSPEGLVAAVLGDESKGLNAGMLTSAPEITVDPDAQNYLDNVVGLQGMYKGASQPGTYTVEVSAEVAELNHRTIERFQPGLTRSDWSNSAHATLAVGTGNSRFSLAARESGTAGNTITLTLTAAGAPSTATSVAVSGEDITVTLGTDGDSAVNATAFEVVEAINAHTQANLLVKAGLSLGAGQESNDGSGVVAAASSASLAGGDAGERVGYEYTPTGYWSSSDYMSNVTLVLPTVQQSVYYVCVVENAINTAEWNPSYDEDGAVAGVGVTWVGHSTAASRDADTGAIRPPIRQFLMDVSAAA